MYRAQVSWAERSQGIVSELGGGILPRQERSNPGETGDCTLTRMGYHQDQDWAAVSGMEMASGGGLSSPYSNPRQIPSQGEIPSSSVLGVNT